MVNKCYLLGNIGKELEIKYLPSGQAVLNFSLATSEKYTDKQGERQDKTEWHKLVVFGKQAETLAKYAGKGTKLYVEGKLQTRAYEGKDGQKNYSTEIIVSEFKFIEGFKQDKSADSYQDRVDFVKQEKAKRGVIMEQQNLGEDVPF